MRIVFGLFVLLAAHIALAATPIDGLYSSVFGGYSYLPNNVNIKTSCLTLTDVVYQPGFDAGGSLGYKSNPLRYEGEITYLNAKLDHYRIDNSRQTGSTGYTNSILAMANVYYDLPEFIHSIQPFLGLGLGYAWVHAKLEASGPIYTSSLNGSNSVFAYQGMAGLTYNFAENYALNLGYRYVGTEKVHDLGKIFQAHMANVGAIYRFDECRYK